MDNPARFNCSQRLLNGVLRSPTRKAFSTPSCYYIVNGTSIFGIVKNKHHMTDLTMAKEPNTLIDTAPSHSTTSSGSPYTSFSERPTTPWKHKEAIVNGIRFHYVQADPARLRHVSPQDQAESDALPRPIVALLHGCFEFWYAWRHQLPVLARAGFLTVAPDLRGHNLSEKPQSGYSINSLSDDVHDFIRHLVKEEQSRISALRTATNDEKKEDTIPVGIPVYLIGHDFGGAIAFAVAARFPTLVNKLIVLNAPHLSKVYSDPLSWSAWFKLCYASLLRCPILPEFLLGSNDAWGLTRLLERTASVDCFDKTTKHLYRIAASHPGALPAMLRYFRKLSKSAVQCRSYDPIQAPVLILWGEDDVLLDPSMASDLSPDYVASSFDFMTIPNCGHWTQQEQPEAVNHHILEFLLKG